MSSILEAQLKKLYLLGTITDKEYNRLLKKYQNEGLSTGLKVEATDLLEKALKHCEADQAKLVKKEEFLKKHLKDLDIHHRKQIEDMKKKIVQEKALQFQDIRRRQNKRLTDITIELSQVNHRSRASREKAMKEKDQKSIEDIRQRIR